ncbi:MAG: hypothetical protein PHS96_07315 [Anaerolineales bacterium]|nr:hypothetical protein [Anaerolineales bacterium]
MAFLSIKPRFWMVFLVGCLAAAAVWVWHAHPASAAVTLRYFTAAPGDGQVTLNWATATELDNLGFYIQRLNPQTGNYQRISDSYTPAATGFSGSEYEYVDDGLINGTTYTYRLESIDNSYQSEFTDPISATPGGPQPSPSATATATATRTATPTATRRPSQGNSGGSTSKKTPTLTPSVRSLGGSTPQATQPGNPNRPQTQASATPTQADQSGLPLASAASEGSGTATLIPLPTIVMEFPPLPTARQVAMQVEGSDAGMPSSGPRWGLLPRLALAGIVIAVWLILGGWFYMTFRQSL